MRGTQTMLGPGAAGGGGTGPPSPALLLSVLTTFCLTEQGKEA